MNPALESVDQKNRVLEGDRAAPPTKYPYAELHCISNFTFLRGASHPGELVSQAYQLGYSALALTDECSMAGVVRAYEAAKGIPIKLIIGSEFRTTDGLHIVLLAPSQTAYAQICTLITKGRMGDGIEKGSYQLRRRDFEKDVDHCLVLWIPPKKPSTSSPAPVERAGLGAAPNPEAVWLKEFFPDRAWIAVELHREAGDALHLKSLQQLGQTVGIPLVATGDVHMHLRERRALQDTVTAIRHRCTIAEAGHRLFSNGERYLRHYQTLVHLYPRTLLEESLRIAERCEFSLGSLTYNYPRELVPEGFTAAQHLRNLTEAGVRTRWTQGAPDKVRVVIEKELALIHQLKYEHFFLTVHDIVQWARSDKDGRKPILCQGRGSAANSIVCYPLCQASCRL